MMNIRKILAAGTLALAFAANQGCVPDNNKKKVEKEMPAGWECGDNYCREAYLKQDNGLNVPNYSDKVVKTFEYRENSESIKIEVADINGDNKPDIVAVTMTSDENLSQRIIYYSKNFDDKATDMFVDNVKAEGGMREFDGYWDYRQDTSGDNIFISTLISEYKKNLDVK